MGRVSVRHGVSALVAFAMLLLQGGAALAMPAKTLVATYVASPPTSVPASTTFVVAVMLTNTGTDTWKSTAPGLMNLSYHWYDASGGTVMWDGTRTPLAGDVAPTQQRLVQLTVSAPTTPGAYLLRIALVQEGVGWLTPSNPYSITAQPPYIARFGAVTLPSFIAGGTYQLTVTNTGNQPWNATGPNPVDLSYHLFDANGNPVIWDGPRIPLGGDIAVGASKQFTISYTAPTTAGTYTLVIDLVREGLAWFQTLGSQPFRQSFAVSSGLIAGYGATTTPQQATIGATLQLTAVIATYGPRTWTPGAFALRYHIYDSGGSPVIWDGARGRLPSDVPPLTSVTVPISVALPSGTGGSRLAWDMVQEGVAWFSQLGVQRKQELFTIVPGVTFYGAGFGHGVGMSPYGANGWATGVTGLTLTGEQIVAHYYPGTALQFVDAQRPNNRVLLSAPSSQGRYVCGDNRYFAGSLADLNSSGGMRVINEGANNQELARGGGGQNFQFIARNGVLAGWASWGTPPPRY